MFFLKKKMKKTKIYAPVKGRIVSLESVKDGVFSEKLLGDGIAILPEEDEIYVPVDGVVSFVMETGHAFGIQMPNGLEVLVHVGIDTVKEAGKGFCTFIKKDQHVKAGMLAITADREYLEKKGYELFVLTLIPDAEKTGVLKHTDSKIIKEINEMILSISSV